MSSRKKSIPLGNGELTIRISATPQMVVISPLNAITLPVLLQLELPTLEKTAAYRSYLRRYEESVVVGDYQCG